MANWDEIHLEESTWTIPATRMKSNVEHRVPLSDQATEVLVHVRDQSDHSERRIFPPEGRGQYIRSERLSGLLRMLDIPAVPHGARSSFRNWAGGRPLIPQPAAEMVLAHIPSEAVVKAYLTGDFFEHRGPIMQEWANYLSETMGSVISTTPT